MDSGPPAEGRQTGETELKNLREELWFILPFFIFSLYLFLGSFAYKVEASTVPKYAGLITAILTGMRLFYICFPRFRIGEFSQDGLAGEFDEMKDEFEEGTLKSHYHRQAGKQVTFRDEIKAFTALIGSFFIFLLFGYLVGTFFVIVVTSYYYGYKKKGAILINLVSMYILVYVILFKLLEAPEHFGLILEPILRALDII